MNPTPLTHVLWTVAASTWLVVASVPEARSEDREPSPPARIGLAVETTGSLPRARSLAGLTTRVNAPTRCLPGELRDVVADVAARFGRVSLESTHRSRGHNRRAGGARQSLHLSCRAVDFRVGGRTRGVMAYLRSRPEVGGLKVYRNGIIHIDNGERRRW